MARHVVILLLAACMLTLSIPGILVPDDVISLFALIRLDSEAVISCKLQCKFAGVH
jgi:hypothetical protein